MPTPAFTVRRARVKDIPAIQRLMEPLVVERILLGKDSAVLYAAVQEFRIAEADDGAVVGCGALHVMWDDLAEIRTVAVDARWRRRRVGHAIVDRLEADALELGVNKLFCLTFEVPFFAAHGYAEVGEGIVGPDVVAELARSAPALSADDWDLAMTRRCSARPVAVLLPTFCPHPGDLQVDLSRPRAT